jgi:ribosomal 30S subunit maturation factor RimM
VTHVPQGLLLEVDSGARAVTIPFVAPIVAGIDRDGRVITIDPPSGLLEL